MVEFLTLRSLIDLDRLSREQSFGKSTDVLHIGILKIVSNFLLGLFQKLIHFLCMIKSGFCPKDHTHVYFPKTHPFGGKEIIYFEKRNKNLKIAIT